MVILPLPAATQLLALALATQMIFWWSWAGWLGSSYAVDIANYSHDPGHTTDLKALAQDILNNHDPAYNAPWK